MGECWPAIAYNLAADGRLIGIDNSASMLRGAEQKKRRLRHSDITINKQNALANPLADGCADCVVSGFGIKTFSDEQKKLLVSEIWRILRTGGTFSLVEVSMPDRGILKPVYMFYLKRVIPFIGQLFLGNPENYRMLGIYTEQFENSKKIGDMFIRQGFRVNYHDYFFGCATGVSGVKP